MTLLQRLVPINIEEEKRKFFFDTNYNPQFAYSDPVNVFEMKKLYGEISTEHLSKAKKILSSVISKWGKESVFLQEVEGEVVSKEELTGVVDQYLLINNLQGKIAVEFSGSQVSAASITGSKLRFRLPITQRKKRMSGTLHHEIGTHYFRTLNDQQQVWNNEREKYKFHNHRVTEEGLATLHSHLDLEHQFMWFTALYYYVVSRSAELSFSSLFSELSEYIDDRDRRWRVCTRAKRGVQDTSIPGGFAKDQIYLNGAIEISQWLKQNDYNPEPLYIGKISLQDIEKAWTINSSYVPLLPSFVENKEGYKRKLQSIIKVNNL